MVPAVVVEQQAKLGVSAEESKAQRLKRQQARFRDRGGAFVPSNSNPLLDILLARTVSGESPSKLRAKDVTPKRLSPSKAHRAVAGSSKSKLPASGKRKEKTVVLQDDAIAKPAPKRRGRPAKGKQKVPDSDTEQQPNTKSKSTSKGKCKQQQRNTNAAPSTSGNKSKTKAKTKSKVMVEALVSDDDQTLVDVPHKTKFRSKKNVQCADDGETDDDAPIIKKRALPPTDDSRTTSTKTIARIKAEKIVGMESSGKKGDEETTIQNENSLKKTSKKRVIPHGDDDDDGATVSPAKKGRAANSTSRKSKNAIKPEPAPCIVKNKPKSGTTGHARGKGKVEPNQDIIDPVEEDIEEPPLECTSKLKKRKKEEDNYDDRPRKNVKFSNTGHPSSQKLKENQSDSGRKDKSMFKSSTRDESDISRPKLGTKPPPPAKGPKGPPREVLDRIKASAVRHLQCADSEPDELDCLS